MHLTLSGDKLYCINKLLRHDVGGNFFNILSSIYKDVKYCIKTENGYTESVSSNIGVKQGCVLSPILFNLFVADMPEIFDNTCDPVELHDFKMNCILYADDLANMSDSATGLQCALDKLLEYCHRWKLTVNLSKTKIMIFNKGGKKVKCPTFHFGSDINYRSHPELSLPWHRIPYLWYIHVCYQQAKGSG